MKVRLSIILLAHCLATTPLRADWKDEIGFTRLQSLAGAELPTTLPQGFTQVEAYASETTNYAPDIASNLFAGKNFTLKSGASAASSHATTVATNFYSTSSLLPDTAPVPVDLYYAGSWMGSGFINLGSNSVPATENRAIQNHSWISTSSNDTEFNQRLDYAINRDGFVCVVGENNGSSNPLPKLLGQSYHTISVGRADGNHTAGLTTFDGSGRIKPDLVAPASQTSYATPMVGSAAGLLYAKLSAAPYSLTGADRPRVIKALLLASATKDTVPDWDNTSTRPLDEKYGAGELNIHHAYHTLRAGQASANTTQYGLRGWSAETINDSSTATYYFSIPAGAPSTPFSAALIWHRNVTTSTSGSGPFKTRTWSSSLANLNLRLHHASGTTLGSVIAESLSAVDNVELVHQSALAPGDYALKIENTSGTSTAYALAWHSLPAVTVAASTPRAKEIDGQQGEITLTRTGDTTLPLYVPLTIGGSAVAGSHYQTLPASIIIPAGQASTTLQITPLADDLAQGDRSVTVSIAADFALVSDPGQSGIVTIEDKPFDAWRFATFSASELADPSISGATADPDGDQIVNLIEYALGVAPKSPDDSSVAMVDSGGYLTLNAPKNPAATDISWAAEVTADLESWSPAVVLTNTASTFEARDSVSMDAANKRMIRLRITRP